jgi:polysaccharide deacetylase family protein (PEP-CTERM system associated)
VAEAGLIKNGLTIDLEDYYQVSAFAAEIPPEQWKSQASRVEANTERILALLDAYGWKATFFTLGWVAEQHPALLNRIASLGHEIGCHSLRHRSVYAMKPEEFQEDTKRAKDVLEHASGAQVSGYRAPSFSINESCPWAFEALVECGFSYDSSIFPVRHPNYGSPTTPRFPYVILTKAGPLVEFPMPTLSLGERRSPFGGGAYLRLLPYWFTRWAFQFLNEREHQAGCLYLHPWELDPEQPRMKGSLTAKLRHYVGLRGLERKLKRLMGDLAFAPLGELVSELRLEPLEALTPELVPAGGQ